MQTLYTNDLRIGAPSFEHCCAPTRRCPAGRPRRHLSHDAPGEPADGRSGRAAVQWLFYLTSATIRAVGRMKFNRRLQRPDVIESKVMVSHVSE